MKKLLFFIFLQSFILVLSQSEIKIIDRDNKNPVAYASVYCKNQLIGKTNAEGILFFKTQCKKIEIKADNFYDEEADVKTKIFVSLTKLDEKSRQIQTVTLKDQSDPRAIDILNKVEKQFKYNSPSSLDSYMFTSYHKYSVDLDKDSIKAYSYYLNKRIDSLKNLPQKNLILKEKKIKDSIENQQIDLMMKESQLMLWETAKEHLYSQKYGEKINVLDNRISGFKDPIYELMSFRSNLNKIPKEINFENRDLYRFFLTDTIDIDGRKTLVIKFRELDKKSTNNRRKFTGFIYIDQATYGIAKIESNSKKLNEGNITSTWKYMYGKWFLASENLKIRIGNTSFKEQNPNTSEKEKPIVKKKFGQYFYMNSLYSGHQSPIPTSSEDFKGYTLSVKNTDGSLLEKYRPNPLSEREQNTYVKIDSLGNSKNFDRKVNFITSLIKGKLRFGKIDYDPLKSFHWNAHEGIRLGINAKLNEKFHSYISPDAYIGYGFSDKKWKYGIGIDVRTSLEKSSFFRLEYADDVNAAGRFNMNLWNPKIALLNSGIDFTNNKFYSYQGFKLSYENDLTNALTAKITLKRHLQKALFEYQFLDYPNSVKDFSTMLTLKYSPLSKNMMTPSGKITYEQKYPEFYFNYEKGWSALGGDFNYQRMDFLFAHYFKTKVGKTNSVLYSGLYTGKSPIWNTFEAGGLYGPSDYPLLARINFSTYLGFPTMSSTRFYNDRFVGWYLVHTLPFHFRTVRLGKNPEGINLLHKGIIGDFKHPEYHKKISFEKLNHLYQEAGVEWNNFFGTSFNLGVFYRVGYYQTNDFYDNIGFQIRWNVFEF